MKKCLIIIFILALVTTFCSSKKKHNSISEDFKKLFIKAKYEFVKRNFHKSIRFSEQILEEYPSFINAYVVKIKCLYYLNKYKDALQQIKIAESFDPFYSNLLFWKAIIYKKLGKNNESIELLKKIIEQDSYNFRAHYELAKLYKETAQYKEALLSYKAALSLEPALLNSRLDIISIYYKLGLKTKAEKLFHSLKTPYIDLAKKTWVYKRYQDWEKKFKK